MNSRRLVMGDSCNGLKTVAWPVKTDNRQTRYILPQARGTAMIQINPVGYLTGWASVIR
jgi:hypothetical protein